MSFEVQKLIVSNQSVVQVYADIDLCQQSSSSSINISSSISNTNTNTITTTTTNNNNKTSYSQLSFNNDE